MFLQVFADFSKAGGGIPHQRSQRKTRALTTPSATSWAQTGSNRSSALGAGKRLGTKFGNRIAGNLIGF
jgi:hypothetical protein